MILHKRQIMLVLLEMPLLGGICVLSVVLVDAGLQMCNILLAQTPQTIGTAVRVQTRTMVARTWSMV